MTQTTVVRLSRNLSCLAALCVLTSCALFEKPVEEKPVEKPEPVVEVKPSAPPPPPAPVAAQVSAFRTQTAGFVPTTFNDLPGWKEDNVKQSWDAFMQSCQILRGKHAAWAEVCANAKNVNTASLPSIRLFFEKEFIPFQIQDLSNRRQGVVTGYFEPQLRGSRQYGAPYIYPVYAAPSDMLYLDVRSIPASARNQTVSATIDGNQVKIGKGNYSLDLKQVALDMLDKKVRLRAEGEQLLPYYTRAEIENLGAPNAKVLAFVDDAAALYEMQIQGSGRIQVNDGSVIRVSMSEQNGHPFRPVLAKNKAGKPATKTTVRGRGIELEADEGGDDEDDSDGIRTRGFKLVSTLVKKSESPSGTKSPALPAVKNSDPSYIFFRENSEPVSVGPVGALGVPLTAERSIAVDPRNVPLGYPVFVSTRNPNTKAPMRRLTVAQDVGGAIRGAVRADYFFGFGQKAKANASRMKENGEMWVLLPREMQLAAAATNTGGVRVRGAGGAEVPLAECLIADDDICVEDGR